MITLKLPYPISANRYWATRVIVPKGTKRAMAMTYVTPEAKAYKEQVGWILKQHGVREALPGRVQVDIQMYPHRPLDFKKRMKADPMFWDDTVQRLDLDNCRKVVNDSLKEIAIQDDFYIFKDSGEVMEPDGREACLIVTIRPYVRAENPQAALELPPVPVPAFTPVPENMPF